ncbi:MAG: hypothetical protein A3K19_31945 [Lentisphaerae bacterium RIFOXYB12_FULL_65_16]|nr:MAG: hypothetical protein A3K18_10725 [Lentisphaerae bacterium RIFOXYA12_64_32]OGV88714.1 MAG: hypothetical protein A3K19_31945 [Lentisphaerae bacterium RIFOXYB12_FULL_65_16]
MDADEAAAFLLDAGLSIPFWPQLPRRSFAEGMIAQYGSGMPCVRLIPDRGVVCLDTGTRMSELEEFYGRFFAEDPSLFPMSSDEAAGLPAFERLAAGRRQPFVKGQTTGPVTLCTSIFDPDRQPLFSDLDLRDAAVKTIVRKVQWQIERLKPLAAEGVLVFVDEPVLAAFGSSSYLYLSEAVVHEMLGEVFAAITGAGAITGIHVCGNSDWGMVARSGVQVINFDAYQYGPSIALYPDDLAPFFERGGCIAWGIVPTTSAVNEVTAEGLLLRLQACFEALRRKGFSSALLRERAILTPSCGTGTLTPCEARRVFELLGQVRELALAAGEV